MVDLKGFALIRAVWFVFAQQLIIVFFKQLKMQIIICLFQKAQVSRKNVVGMRLTTISHLKISSFKIKITFFQNICSCPQIVVFLWPHKSLVKRSPKRLGLKLEAITDLRKCVKKFCLLRARLELESVFVNISSSLVL